MSETEIINNKLDVLMKLLLMSAATNLRYQSLQITMRTAMVEPPGKKKNELLERTAQIYAEYKIAAEDTDEFIHEIMQLFEEEDTRKKAH